MEINLSDQAKIALYKLKHSGKKGVMNIASERDSIIFFNAITHPQKPSETLKSALNDYNSFIINSK